MDNPTYENLKVIWDYMPMNMKPCKADCIVGFGSYNDDIAVKFAQLYKMGLAPKVLFTGGLGRNASGI